MVLPGIRGDKRTPGGMPDSGRVNPGGPVPSVPQGTRQPNMGAGIGEPDPKKIEEMFTQYTAGQITRDDLFTYLHGESEGRGGILGLLEGVQEQGMGQPNKGTQPNQSKSTIPGTGGPGGAIVQGGLTSPGAAGVSIPPIKEPLDKRHQDISTLLQGYGLGPADADQMSTLLNPHIDGSSKGHDTLDESYSSYVRPGENPNLSGRPSSIPEPPAPTPAAAAAPSTPNVSYMSDWEGNTLAGTSNVTPSQWTRPVTASEGPNISNISYASDPGVDGSRSGPSISNISYADDPTGGRFQAGANLLNRDDGGRNPNLDVKRGLPSSDVVPTPVAAPIPATKDGKDGKDGKDSSGKEPGITDVVGNLHPMAEGMPEGYGGATGWLSWLSSWAKGNNTDVNRGNPPTEIYEDETSGMTFPSRPVFNQFISDMKGAFSNSASPGKDGRPTIWTKDGRVSPEFMGWNSDGTPRFGLPGIGSANQFFGMAEPSNGEVYYFTSASAAEIFDKTGNLPDGGKIHRSGDQQGIVVGSRDAPVVITVGELDAAPEGYSWQEEIGGGYILVADDTGKMADRRGDNWVVPKKTDDGTPELPSPVPSTTPDESLLAGSLSGADLDLRGGGSYPMFDAFLQQINTDVNAADSTLTASLAESIKDLEIMYQTGQNARAQRLADVVVNDLDRAAVTLRAELDRGLQSDVAMGKIGQTATLAARVENNKAAIEASKLSGTIPTLDTQGNLTTGGEESLEGRVVTMTEAEKEDQRNQNMTQLFGQWMSGDPTTNIATLEREKYGLTKSIAAAEISGQIPTGMPGEGGKTMSAKRMAWEQDVARQNANTQTQLARNGVRRNEIDLQIANNKISSDEFIASGQLAEAVEARKDATFLAKQKLDIEREKMKLDTLTALSNPATYLFAVRYGLLDQIGGVLGIQWGDDAITNDQLPRMVEPGTFPSLTDFQNATPTEREIMLAEVASSGGFTTDEAVRMIIEGAPGGQDIRRTSLVGVSR